VIFAKFRLPNVLGNKIKLFNSAIFSIFLLYKTNRLHFPVVCSVIDTQYGVICGKNKK
jgi:hypothetical protein